ncbi:DNA-binding CsgD family transcriptional regulator [Agrobacterium larrymoorei]|uniref:DNA-binding CsgD family transcriptional regulator n=1 Tax=Agrobacterium larrymoorei TaxID=160699 RepID=A0AAJ2B9C3_9HYPH|nr:LuxR family transcriptional regulator [Agrobacterium larrymoorei]MDR6100487.1 DNA-binding CsgD family transcriptional regulator [Agrobacterium larrymoorei]
MARYERLSKVCARISKSAEESDVHNILSDICLYYGVDHATFLHEAGVGVPISFVSTYPESWCERYRRENYLHIDPTIKLMTSGLLPADWDALSEDSKAEKDFFQDALCFGIGAHGMSIPTRGPFGQRGLFTVASALPLDEWQNLKLSIIYDVHILALYLHDRMFRLKLGGRKSAPHSLSRREKECLELLAYGKIPKQISATLNISESAVRHCLQSARHKMKATTTYKALAQAVALGLIDVQTPDRS